jgi:TonB family protein
VFIHGLIFLILLFFMLRSSIPPFPDAAGGSGGVLVNIGYVESASGEIQPMSENITENPNPEKIREQPKVEEEKILTSTDAEAPVVKTTDKKETKKNIKKDTKVPVLTEKKIAVPVRTVDPRSLYQGKNTSSTSQGTAKSGSGDQGDPQGDPYSKYTGKNGNGNGPGEGDGTGSGKGPGNGGISFDLAGRRLVRKPSIDDKSQETGRVVVSITVDKGGNVTEARPGARGSTTTSSYLFGKAKEAAMKAKFSPNPDGADIQKGTMTFVFLVQ